MTFRYIGRICIIMACLALLLCTTDCRRKDDNPGQAKPDEPKPEHVAKEIKPNDNGTEPEFEGNWLMVASETADKEVTDATKEEFKNYHKNYRMGQENGKWFFQPTSDPEYPGDGPKQMFEKKGRKLVTDDGWMRQECEIINNQLVNSYFLSSSGEFSHKVTFIRVSQ